jgi:hypothetical protein
MRKPVVLITVAGGDFHGLMAQLAGPSRSIITLDVTPLDKALRPLVTREFTGSITDADLLDRLLAEFEVDLIFHLAALLSTRSEFTPMTAHHVNVEGTLNLLEFAQRQGESHGRPVVFMYPSSVAAYGLPSLAENRASRKITISTDDDVRLQHARNVSEGTRHHKQLAADASWQVDFRCVRFRIDFGDGAVGRDIRLRARDDSCRSAGAYVLRPARHWFRSTCGRSGAAGLSTRRGGCRGRRICQASAVGRRHLTSSEGVPEASLRSPSTRSARRSSIRGRHVDDSRRAPTGASARRTTCALTIPLDD